MNCAPKQLNSIILFPGVASKRTVKEHYVLRRKNTHQIRTFDRLADMGGSKRGWVGVMRSFPQPHYHFKIQWRASDQSK
jgi:hypothetical protein